MGPNLRWNSEEFHLFCFILTSLTFYIYIHEKKMYRSLLNIIVLVIFTQVIEAQERYSGFWFDEVSVETYTYVTKDGEDLQLDIYLPQSDADFNRASVIFVHGGGFSGGKRNDEMTTEFCNQLAGYGYVVASISYRLTRKGKESGFGCNCPATDKINTFNMAVEDLQDATFFLVQNREQFGIDPQKMILAGSSAGAETVLNTAYLPPMCYGLDSGPVSYAGVISFAGAIPDTVVIYDESAIPSLLFHGTDDNLVPYATAPHHYCNNDDPGYIVLHGSKTIAQKLNDLNVVCWLHTTCGGGHELASTPMTDYFDVIADFCYEAIIIGESESRSTIINGKQKSGKFPQFDFCND